MSKITIEDLAGMVQKGFKDLEEKLVSKDEFNEFRNHMLGFEKDSLGFQKQTTQSLYELNHKVDSIDERLISVEGRLGNVESKLDSVIIEVRGHDKRIRALEAAV